MGVLPHLTPEGPEGEGNDPQVLTLPHMLEHTTS